MIEKAYAKINLGLNVLNKREDGYHDIESILLPLQLHDSVEVTVLKDGRDDLITCDIPTLSDSKSNVCHHAIELLREKYNFTERFRVNIHKRIFIQAGLGGGSADAAATIRCVIKLLKLEVNEEDILKIALEVGCDVPWSIKSAPALIEKKGEKITYFDSSREDYVLLVKPLKGLSTRAVFEKSDELELEKCDLGLIKEKFLNDEDLNGITKNALQQVAITLVPEIESLIALLKEEGLDFVMMSGSGTTVFGFTKNKKLAEKLEEKYFKKGYQVELTKLLKA